MYLLERNINVYKIDKKKRTNQNNSVENISAKYTNFQLLKLVNTENIFRMLWGDPTSLMASRETVHVK